jgi:hypothetical protein
MKSTYRNKYDYRAQLEFLQKYFWAHREALENIKLTSPINTYSGRRGAMVVDAICSRRRNYETRVLSMVAKWESANLDGSLLALASGTIDERQLGLMKGEADTLRQVADGLLLFGQLRGISNEDKMVAAWASDVESIRYVHEIDPFVGCVKGVGPALFAYLRILSGADAIKPDVRVREKLNKFGFDLPKSDVALMHLCELFADDLKIPRRDFDMLLWEDLRDDFASQTDNGARMMVLVPGADAWTEIK